MKGNATRMMRLMLLMLVHLQAFPQARKPEIGGVYPARPAAVSLATGFLHPPDPYRPGVYWYFMDGNLSRESITKDLESMKEAGIGYVTFLEVNVGVPRGPVGFLSEAWQQIFVHAVREAERLGIHISLGTGPGWAGSGGPWVPAQASMQHLVHWDTTVAGGQSLSLRLQKPAPKKPFFGEGSIPATLRPERDLFYRDVALLAWPARDSAATIPGVDEKALYYRAPFSSQKGVKPFFLPPQPDTATGIPTDQIIDLTARLSADGTLNWEMPPGRWTIMRFGARNNGAVTRPAPVPGLGFEVDKFDTAALDAHLDHYVGALLKKTGIPHRGSAGGLQMLHIDSWEMGAQNWTGNFRAAFLQRRGYDPQPFYPVYAGVRVGNAETSERFLWDLRQTAQELILENHAGHTKKYAHRYGLGLSVEPYDMNPTQDLSLGATGDVTMAEFWNKGKGFNTNFSCVEAVSVAHVNGQPLVPAESFTSDAGTDGWQQYPGNMKNQGDWALAAGINRFVFHTFQNQYLPDQLRPGMTMGPYGVHWDRNQTWWPMAGAYHRYLSRCQFMLQQGRSVADILYLAPEDAPHVFLAPPSAYAGDSLLPDRRGFNFDACAPSQLYKATVQKGRIVFPGGASYRMLVLPIFPTMTVPLLRKICELVKAGATIAGVPPLRTPGLFRMAANEKDLAGLKEMLWGISPLTRETAMRKVGQGAVFSGFLFGVREGGTLYPSYATVEAVLKGLGMTDDFRTLAEQTVRYTHRLAGSTDLYFVSNKTADTLTAQLHFRVKGKVPARWDPLDGSMEPIRGYKEDADGIALPLPFAAYQSFFVVFTPGSSAAQPKRVPVRKVLATIPLDGPWTVHFDTAWGGPATVRFDSLTDWAHHPDKGIRYYSGIATYQKVISLPLAEGSSSRQFILGLGPVPGMARVRVNGRPAGVVWTAPWQTDVTALLKKGDNLLEIEVANLWANRLIGDAALPDDGIQGDQWPHWLQKGLPRTSGRYTFTTYKYYKPDAPLLPSGLLGPVVVKVLD